MEGQHAEQLVDKTPETRDVPPQQSESRERQFDIEHLDDAINYVPDLNSIKHKDVAEGLVLSVKEAGKSLEDEMKVSRKKVAYFKDFDAKLALLEAEAEKKPGLNFGDDKKRIARLWSVYTAESPYESLQQALEDDEFEIPPDRQEELRKYEKTFSVGTKIKHLVWDKQVYQKKVGRATELGREVAEYLYGEKMGEFSQLIKLADEHAQAFRDELPRLYLAFVNADDSQLKTATEALEVALTNYFEEVKKSREMQDFVDSLVEIIGEDEEYWMVQPHRMRRWSLLSQKADIGYLKNSLEIAKQSLEVGMKHRRADSALINLAYEKTRDINDLFTIPGKQWPSDYRRTREEWSITKEYLLALREFIILFKKASRQTGLKFNSQVRYLFAQIDEGKRISGEGTKDQQERLLTHTAPTEVIYEVLARGDLSSVVEQSKKHKKSRRTHHFNEGSWKDKTDCETHDVTFEPDHIYHNFSSNPKKSVHGFESHIALVFDENQLLSSGLQYAVYDGLHLFDPGFKGSGTNSPGLSIDLKTTPHMIIVTKAEKDKMLAFLKEQSYHRDYLGNMSPEEFDSWVESNVIVVDNLESFEVTPEMKKKFFEAKKLRLQRGFVELTDAKAQFKVGDQENIYQFIPFASKNRQAGKIHDGN